MHKFVAHNFLGKLLSINPDAKTSFVFFCKLYLKQFLRTFIYPLSTQKNTFYENNNNNIFNSFHYGWLNVTKYIERSIIFTGWVSSLLGSFLFFSL